MRFLKIDLIFYKRKPQQRPGTFSFRTMNSRRREAHKLYIFGRQPNRVRAACETRGSLFGGVKNSGFGNELSVYGIWEFVKVKSVWVG